MNAYVNEKDPQNSVKVLQVNSLKVYSTPRSRIEAAQSKQMAVQNQFSQSNQVETDESGTVIISQTTQQSAAVAQSISTVVTQTTTSNGEATSNITDLQIPGDISALTKMVSMDSNIMKEAQSFHNQEITHSVNSNVVEDGESITEYYEEVTTNVTVSHVVEHVVETTTTTTTVTNDTPALE